MYCCVCMFLVPPQSLIHSSTSNWRDKNKHVPEHSRPWTPKMFTDSEHPKKCRLGGLTRCGKIDNFNIFFTDFDKVANLKKKMLGNPRVFAWWHLFLQNPWSRVVKSSWPFLRHKYGIHKCSPKCSWSKTIENLSKFFLCKDISFFLMFLGSILPNLYLFLPFAILQYKTLQFKTKLNATKNREF